LSPQGLDILKSEQGVELDYQPGLSEEQLAQAIKNADGLVIRSGSQVTARVIEAADRLRVIGRAGIGVDNVDVDAASKRGIAVMNTPTGNAVTTAEHTLSLLMSLARWIPAATSSMKAGKWEKKKFQGRELAGKRLGVIGLGTIGRIVADRARGLQMRVSAFDPVVTPDRAAAMGVELVDLETLWQTADVITVHTPLTPQTRGLIDDAVVPKLKEGVLLINCARGGIYDEQAVLRGLESGRIGGAAFDVFDQEPPAADDPLVRHERVVCTPHLGASTQEAQDRVAFEIAEQVLAFLVRGEVKNALNMPSISGELAAKVDPYVILAKKLGRFLAQVEPIVPRGIEVECVGEGPGLAVQAVSAAAVAGFFEHFLDVPVNSISAPHLAADRGITVREQKTSDSAQSTHVEVRVCDADGTTHAVRGALGGDGSPRLTHWRNFDIEARLDGRALVVESIDKPGVIGFLGTSLGDAGVNVHAVHLGKSSDGHALSIWNLDDALAQTVLDEMQASPNVSRALLVQL
jgi:D-3-phosphoglycerate dehydrogenase